MQIRVINGGEQAFNAMIYQPPDQSILNHINSSMARVGEIVGTAGTAFMDTTKSLYEKFNNSAVLNAAKLMVYSLGGHMSQDQIFPLNYDNMHTANNIMQHYIMSDLTINKMYNDNMCYGFQNTYYDLEQGVVGKDREHYKAVMDGVLEIDEDGYCFTNTYSSSDAIELSHFDKYAILDTWAEAKRMLVKGIDPTSPDRDEL